MLSRAFRALGATVPLCGMIGSCLATDEAQLSASKNGDLTYLLEPRERPDAELVERCGSGELTPRGRELLRRRPYLQRVSEQRASVLFTSVASEPVEVDVTLPDGTKVLSATASVDAGNPRSSWQGIGELEGLQPGTMYCYELRGLTARAGFVTAPAADTGARVRFLVFGDSGSGSDSQRLIADQMETVPFDLILHTGDVAYDAGTLEQYESSVFGVYAGLFKSFSFFPVAGNHDCGTSDCGPFRQVFSLPDNGIAEAKERFYSFDWGDVHFLALDTERIDDLQASWLAADLAATRRPWKIVYGHRPPYSSGEHGSDSDFRERFVPLFAKYGVKLVLAGHDHDYERSRPLEGVTYVVTGGGGKSTRAVSSSSFTAFSEDVLHFVEVTIEGRELWLYAIDGTGRQFDSARITL